jgi:hypothetical protein
MNEFIFELVRRWGAKQPWFFKVVQWIGLAVALVLGLPEYLFDAGVLDQLPDAFQRIVDKAVLWAGLIAAFISKLTATSDAKVERQIVD